MASDVASSLRAISGLVRPNRFSVSIYLPGNGISNHEERVESVEFPALALGTADFQYNTQPIIKIPYAKLPSQTCNITFRLDGDGNPTGELYAFMEKASPKSQSDYFMEYVNNLWGTLKIVAMDSTDKKLYAVSLNRVLITNIDSAQLSFDDRDSYLKQTVTFSYQDAEFTRWTISKEIK